MELYFEVPVDVEKGYYLARALKHFLLEFEVQIFDYYFEENLSAFRLCDCKMH